MSSSLFIFKSTATNAMRFTFRTELFVGNLIFNSNLERLTLYYYLVLLRKEVSYVFYEYF